ncbi:MAG: hypothetical protein ACREOJ_15230 [Gemmatimonadaceae bacterium]
MSSLLHRARADAALARVEIRHGRFQRSMAVITGVSAIASGFEAYMQHRRGAFSNWLMWTPVGLTPVAVAAAGAALVSRRAARQVLPIVSLLSLADGVIGFGLHLRGIRNRPGGFRTARYNLVMGPPVFAPLLTGIVGVTGLMAARLRREERPVPGRTARELDRLMRVRHRMRHNAASHHGRVAHGEFQRALALTTALFAALAGGEAYVEHLRGSFNNALMWSPIVVTPPMLGAALGAVVSRRIARRVLPFTSVVTLLDGVLGFGLHVRGLARMPGGADNLAFKVSSGPPLFAPLLFTSVGMLGLITSLLRRSGR